MNDDINLRIKFIQEIERHPYLYDHNHALYNHRDKIEATWKKIGQLFGEESDACKKKWRLIRCSYTRSLKTQTRQRNGPGVVLSKGYYMAPHLRFLDPFLKAYVDNYLIEDEDSIDHIDGNNIVQVTLDSVKVERTDDDEEYQFIEEDGDTSQDYLVEKRSHSGDEDTNTNTSKKRKVQEVHAVKDRDPNEMYLLSLMPYIESMTERQKLAFQKGVVELIENIKYKL